MNLHPDTMPFLEELALNNNREWFNDNKPRYLAIKEQFEAFTTSLLEKMQLLDLSLSSLNPKKCIYRIYRDIRFSPDKRPYKTHLSCFFPSYGIKNVGMPGYYFQIGSEEAYGLKGACNLGGGIFMPSAEYLAAIKQEIFYCPDDFEAIITEREYLRYYGDDFLTTKKLTRVPKGYPNDWEHANWLKCKDYCSAHTLNLDNLAYYGESDLTEAVVKVWRATIPLNLFIQRALSM